MRDGSGRTAADEVIVPVIVERETVDTPLGIDVDATSTVTALAHDSPARGCLQLGDAIVSVDGQPVADGGHLDALLACADVRIRFAVRRVETFTRDGAEVTAPSEVAANEKSKSDPSAVALLKAGRKGYDVKMATLKHGASTAGLKLAKQDGRVVVRSVPTNLLADGQLARDDAIINVSGEWALDEHDTRARIDMMLLDGDVSVVYERAVTASPKPKTKTKPQPKPRRIDVYGSPTDVLGAIERHRMRRLAAMPRPVLLTPATRALASKQNKLSVTIADNPLRRTFKIDSSSAPDRGWPTEKADKQTRQLKAAQRAEAKAGQQSGAAADRSDEPMLRRRRAATPDVRSPPRRLRRSRSPRPSNSKEKDPTPQDK